MNGRKADLRPYTALVNSLSRESSFRGGRKCHPRSSTQLPLIRILDTFLERGTFESAKSKFIFVEDHVAPESPTRRDPVLPNTSHLSGLPRVSNRAGRTRQRRKSSSGKFRREDLPNPRVARGASEPVLANMSRLAARSSAPTPRPGASTKASPVTASARPRGIAVASRPF